MKYPTTRPVATAMNDARGLVKVKEEPMTKRTPEIPNQIDAIMKELEYANNCVSSLEERLQSVLRPQESRPCDPCETPRPYSNGILGALEKVNAEVSIIRSRIAVVNDHIML